MTHISTSEFKDFYTKAIQSCVPKGNIEPKIILNSIKKANLDLFTEHLTSISLKDAESLIEAEFESNESGCFEILEKFSQFKSSILSGQTSHSLETSETGEF